MNFIKILNSRKSIFLIFAITLHTSCTTNYYLPEKNEKTISSIDNYIRSNENNIPTQKYRDREVTEKEKNLINKYGMTEKEYQEKLESSWYLFPNVLTSTLGENFSGSIEFKKLLISMGYRSINTSIEQKETYEIIDNTYHRTYKEKGYVERFNFIETAKEGKVYTPILTRFFCKNRSDSELIEFWEIIYRAFKAYGEPLVSENLPFEPKNTYYRWDFSSGNNKEKGVSVLSEINAGCFMINTCNLKSITLKNCEEILYKYKNMKESSGIKSNELQI